MDAAENPAEFCACEREVHALALELAAEVTRRALQRLSDDKLRRAAALAQVRSRASKRGIELRVERVRKTKVRTLSGQVEVVTPYATARPRGKVPMKRRGSQGTGVYPVLDALGIKERSTPALRLLVSRAVCEANSVTSARELLQMSGVQLGHKTALRLTYDVCEEALRARRQALRRQKGADDHGAFAGRRVVAAIDGGRVQIRHRVAGRPRKGGRKRFETEWREPKVLTIYVLDEHGKRDRKVASVIDGTLGGADDAFALLLFHLRRLGVHKAKDKDLDYWVRHRDRLRFASFRRRGLPCGSGAVESSVRRVVNLRMKGASVTWTEAHAEGVLHLRAHAKSGRWSELENTVLSTTGWRPTARQPRQTA